MVLDDAILYYSFDNANNDGSGNPQDLSGNGNHGTNNGATTGVTGKLSQAFDFDGSNDYVQMDDTIDDTNQFSISLWANLDTSSGDQPFVSAWGSNSLEHTYLLRVLDGNLQAYIQTSDGFYGGTTQALTTTGSWVHIVVVYGGSKIETYVNNVKSGNSISATGSIYHGTNPDYVGREKTNYFNGKIDEVGIWSRTLTSTEVSELYNSGNGFNPYRGWGNLINGVTASKVNGVETANIASVNNAE